MDEAKATHRSIEQVLLDIEAILLECNILDYTDLVKQTRELINTNKVKAITILTQGDFWGGAGSVSDLILISSVAETYPGVFKRYNRVFNLLLLELIHVLCAEGYESPAMLSRMDFLEKSTQDERWYG